MDKESRFGRKDLIVFNETLTEVLQKYDSIKANPDYHELLLTFGGDNKFDVKDIKIYIDAWHNSLDSSCYVRLLHLDEDIFRVYISQYINMYTPNTVLRILNYCMEGSRNDLRKYNTEQMKDNYPNSRHDIFYNNLKTSLDSYKDALHAIGQSNPMLTAINGFEISVQAQKGFAVYDTNNTKKISYYLDPNIFKSYFIEYVNLYALEIFEYILDSSFKMKQGMLQWVQLLHEAKNV